MKTTSFRLPAALGLPAVLGLLAAPRAVLHDLELIEPETGLNAGLVVVPLVVWIVVAVRGGPGPFRLLLRTGLAYGFHLAVIHNLLWDGTARLGGNLTGRLSGPAEELVLRATMSLSSLVTGVLVGAACGAVAWLIARPKWPARQEPPAEAPIVGRVAPGEAPIVSRVASVEAPIVSRASSAEASSARQAPFSTENRRLAAGPP
ncbi:MAG TPA: hypothetical protein VN408_13420 [Actinoplanes sp.]|nr:hypothetical protein [Actinoplanes sp.]